MHLLTVGEAFDDLVMTGLPRLPRLGEELRVVSFSQHPGGGALITAIAAARLGLEVRTLTAVSAATAARLRDEGVAVANLRQPEERAAVTVALSTPRDRAFVTFDGVNSRLEPRLLRALAAPRLRPRHVHFALAPKHCRRWLPLLGRLRARAITTSWDFGWNEPLVRDRAFAALLAALDWVFVNEREATLYSRTRSLTAARRAWPRLARATVIKRGAAGAIALYDGGVVHAPAIRVTAIDTTGAGDAFNAGFLAALLARAAVADALRVGNHVGGRSTRAAGGVDGLPRRAVLPASVRRVLQASS